MLRLGGRGRSLVGGWLASSALFMLAGCSLTGKGDVQTTIPIVRPTSAEELAQVVSEIRTQRDSIAAKIDQSTTNIQDDGRGAVKVAIWCFAITTFAWLADRSMSWYGKLSGKRICAQIERVVNGGRKPGGPPREAPEQASRPP